MIILSLFDGISAGRVALERAGVAVDEYYSSEIDKYCIQISQKNYPDIKQLGDIKKWRGWDIKKPDLIIGGSPCQGFSFAGKQLAFNDKRSVLFFEYINILKHYKPKYFLLENVPMKKEFLEIISNEIGVEPILINSALVSAQQRKRYYWTNIPNVSQPVDKQIYLKNIIENGVCDKDKSYCIDANYWKGGNLVQYFEKHRRQLVFNEPNKVIELDRKGYSSNKSVYDINGKSPCLLANSGGQKEPKILQTRECGRRLTQDGTKRDDKNGLIVRGYEVRKDGKTCALTTVLKDNFITEEFVIRKLTPIECERLQTFPDNYTEGVSNTQRYKMLGNSWTVDVIAHILKFININKGN